MSAFSLLIFPATVITNLLEFTERSATDGFFQNRIENPSRRFGESLEPRLIFGAMMLNQ